jgi:chaperonin GroEL
MMPQTISQQKEIQEKLCSGVDRMANTVKITLGPKGRNVLLQVKTGSPQFTSDGAAIAKEVQLPDPTENMGAQILRGMAVKLNDRVGDGTTAAIVLTQQLVREGMRNLAAGASPIALKKGIQGATQVAVAALRKLSKPADDREVIAQAATIAAGDAQVGGMIADALEKFGKEGVITVNEGKGMETTLDLMPGMQFDRGHIAPGMATDQDNLVTEMDSPYILVTDYEITSAQELTPILEQVAQEGAPLLIIAEDVKDEALGLLAVNKARGVLDVAAVRAPAYGDGRKARLEDLSILTGGAFVSKSRDYVLSQITTDDLGSASRVRVEQKNTFIIDGDGDPEAVEERARYLRILRDHAEYEFDRKQLEERLAKLTSGVAAINVGGATESEMKEKKQRVEEALHAARAAVAEGVVPGGGVALMNTIPAVQAYARSLSGDEATGAYAVVKALSAPLRQIAENGGLDGSAVTAKVGESPAI